MEFTRAVQEFPPFPPPDLYINVEIPPFIGWAILAFIVLASLVMLSALIIGWRIAWAFFKYKYTYVGRHEKDDFDESGEDYVEESRLNDTGPHNLAELMKTAEDFEETNTFPRIETDPNLTRVTNHPAPKHPSESDFLA